MRGRNLDKLEVPAFAQDRDQVLETCEVTLWQVFNNWLFWGKVCVCVCLVHVCVSVCGAHLL